jgi:hypothetical protein
LKRVFLLDLKINAPWEKTKFTAWRYNKFTNIVLSAVHTALKAEDDCETAGEKRNVILDEPGDALDDLNNKIVTLFEEQEPYILSRQPHYRDSEEFPREVELARNKLTALGSSLKIVLRKIYKIASQICHV